MLVGSKLLYIHGLLSPSRSEFYKNNIPDEDLILLQGSTVSENSNVDILVNPFVYKLLQDLKIKLLSKNNYKDCVAIMMLTLKLSHMHYDLLNSSWHKHLHDIKHLFNIGYEPDKEYLLLLKNEWTQYYKGKEKIKLNKKPENFFVADYNQSHDELHIHFMFGSEPIYKRMLKDNSEIAVDFNKFNNLTEQDKLYSVVEESMVIGYERDLSLLNGFKHLYAKLSKGWWNDYITLNFKEVIQSIEEHSYTFKLKSKQLIK